MSSLFLKKIKKLFKLKNDNPLLISFYSSKVVFFCCLDNIINKRKVKGVIKLSYIWGFMILVSLIFASINGTLSQTVEAGFAGASSAANIVLSFAGIMCFWTGILHAAERAGISGWIKKLLSPLIKILFPKLDQKGKAAEFITLNITANLLGMGNGATPMGIKAMKELDCNTSYPTDEMCMFIVLNTTAFQLIPSSIIALRSGFMSSDPFSVIVPIWISSFTALTVSAICVKIMCKWGIGK